MGSDQTFIRAEPYNFPHDGSLSLETTALIVIDMQRDFLEKGGYIDVSQGLDYMTCRNAISGVLRLLVHLRHVGYPIFYTRECHRPDLSTLSSRELFRSRIATGKGIGDTGPLGRFLIKGEPGYEIIDGVKPKANEIIIDKPGRSAFAHTDFEHILRLKGIQNLIFTGVTTDVCVSSTMREANDRGFDCLLVSDATAAGSEYLHQWAIESVKGEGGIFGCVSEVFEVVKAVDPAPESMMRRA